MPSWGIHLQIANLLSKRISNINKNQFIFGNILPDINNGYVIKGISQRIVHNITHCDGGEDFKNYKIFYNKYKNQLKNPIVLGYLTHLLTDFYYNDLTYAKRGIHDKDGNIIGIKLNTGEHKLCTQEEARIIKTNDFKIFSDYIYKNKNLDKIKYDNELLSANNMISEINITEEDILKTIEYLNLHIEGKQKALKEEDSKEYRIFNENEFIQHLDLCVNFIIEYLQNKGCDLSWK